MLRRHRMTAGVGRTILSSCDARVERDSSCNALQRSGRQPTAELRTYRARCDSACGLALIGAVERQVAPGTLLGIHNPPGTGGFWVDGFLLYAPENHIVIPKPGQVHRFKLGFIDYIADMGIDPAYFEAIEAFRHRHVRFLTRGEIARFRIDAREFVESPWHINDAPFTSAMKLVTKSGTGAARSRTVRFDLHCTAQGQIELLLTRELADAREGADTVTLAHARRAGHFSAEQPIWSRVARPYAPGRDAFGSSLARLLERSGDIRQHHLDLESRNERTRHRFARPRDRPTGFQPPCGACWTIAASDRQRPRRIAHEDKCAISGRRDALAAGTGSMVTTSGNPSRHPMQRVLQLFLVAALGALGAPGLAAAQGGKAVALRKPAKPEVPASYVEMMFFLAKGEPGACGPGCSEWIAAEGTFDRAAGIRFKAFLRGLGKKKLPIFFHSPGGVGPAGTEMGRALRERRMTAGVGRTIPAPCDASFSGRHSAMR